MVFGPVGLGVDDIRNFELVGVDEEQCWSEDGIDILYQDLMHFFQFTDLSCEVWRDGRARGQVSG